MFPMLPSMRALHHVINSNCTTTTWDCYSAFNPLSVQLERKCKEKEPLKGEVEIIKSTKLPGISLNLIFSSIVKLIPAARVLMLPQALYPSVCISEDIQLPVL